MDLKKHTNGRIYAHVHLSPTGRAKPISTGVTTMAAAKRVVKEAGLERIELAARAGSLNVAALSMALSGQKLTCEATVTEWIEVSKGNRSENTIEQNKLLVMAFLRQAELVTAAPLLVTIGHIDSYVNDPDMAWKAKTRARILTAIRSWLTFCLHRGYIARNPAVDVSVNTRALRHAMKEPKRVLPLTEYEIEATLAAVDTLRCEDMHQEWRLYIRISWATGMRREDLVCLEVDSLSIPGFVLVHTRKAGVRVPLPINDTITPGLADALTELNPDEDGWCFPRLRAVFLQNKSTISVTFGRLLQRAGITEEGKSLHSLRHTRFTAWDKQGFSLDQLQEWGGHTPGSKSTAGYIHK